MTYPNFDALNFDNRFTRELAADPVLDNSRRQVREAVYSRVKPSHVKQPKLIIHSAEMLAHLGLNATYSSDSDFTETLSGNRLAKGMDAYATCYGGHQFGHWAGQLGDGRAINLGEVINPQNERWAIQLKGAGPTPYSRQADGLAVLRSSVREFLCSEAMFHLGVPTTRALSLITTGEQVMRDMFYDGNAGYEAGAVVCRTAPSFTRFGHFQILAANHDLPLLKKLIDYTIRTDFPHLVDENTDIDHALMHTWFKEVCTLSAKMITHWMRVGFVHGVMNTDNMSILGLTIDYGPYGWLEDFDPDWTPNTTDKENRRYRFGNQPSVTHWNLSQLAQAIAQLTETTEPLQAALDHYADYYDALYQEMMLAKLGIVDADVSDTLLIETTLSILQNIETDMTIFFRQLSQINPDANLSDEALCQPLQVAYYSPEDANQNHIKLTASWLRELITRWQASSLSHEARIELMNKTNPKYVLRNYLAQMAIDKADQGDNSLIHELHAVLKAPYTEQDGKEMFAEKRPEWARHRAGCSMLSCSS